MVALSFLCVQLRLATRARRIRVTLRHLVPLSELATCGAIVLSEVYGKTWHDLLLHSASHRIFVLLPIDLVEALGPTIHSSIRPPPMALTNCHLRRPSRSHPYPNVNKTAPDSRYWTMKFARSVWLKIAILSYESGRSRSRKAVF